MLSRRRLQCKKEKAKKHSAFPGMDQGVDLDGMALNVQGCLGEENHFVTSGSVL